MIIIKLLLIFFSKSIHVSGKLAVFLLFYYYRELKWKCSRQYAFLLRMVFFYLINIYSEWGCNIVLQLEVWSALRWWISYSEL